jgi:glycosyl transferase family 25
MDHFWINNVIGYGSIPACLTNDPQFNSEIGYKKNPKRALKTKFIREWYNAKNNFLRLIFLAKLKNKS